MNKLYIEMNNYTKANIPTTYFLRQNRSVHQNLAPEY
jgi:hypothetical protein